MVVLDILTLIFNTVSPEVPHFQRFAVLKMA